MVLVEERQKGKSCLKWKEFLFFIEVGQVSMNKSREAIVHKLKVKLLQACTILIRSIPCSLLYPLSFLHQKHKRCHYLHTLRIFGRLTSFRPCLYLMLLFLQYLVRTSSTISLSSISFPRVLSESALTTRWFSKSHTVALISSSSRMKSDLWPWRLS